MLRTKGLHGMGADSGDLSESLSNAPQQRLLLTAITRPHFSNVT